MLSPQLRDNDCHQSSAESETAVCPVEIRLRSWLQESFEINDLSVEIHFARCDSLACNFPASCSLEWSVGIVEVMAVRVLHHE